MTRPVVAFITDFGAEAGEIVTLLNTSDHLEIAMRVARAADRVDVKRGAVVEVRPPR